MMLAYNRSTSKGWALLGALCLLGSSACTKATETGGGEYLDAAAYANARDGGAHGNPEPGSSNEPGTTPKPPGPVPVSPAQPGSVVPGNTPTSVGDDAGLFGGGVPTLEVGGGPNAPSQPASTPTEDPTDPPIVECDSAKGDGVTALIDDFEDGDNSLIAQDGRDGSWYSYNSADDSDAQTFEMVTPSGTPSPAGGERALHTAGSGFDWAGIGFGPRWSETDANGNDLSCMYDASLYEGITFWGRGTGSVKFTAAVPESIPLASGGACDEVEGPCWDNPGKAIEFTEEWQQFVLPFAEMLQSSGDLALDPTRIRTMQFETGSQATFDFWIDGMAFYSSMTPPPPPVVVPDPAPTDPAPTEPAPTDPAPTTAPDAGTIDPTSASDAGASDASVTQVQ
ncbi:MAG TPA: hypothetical protein VHM70_16825 [Polyangiaceae bacterium]|nr:hypothetical protein [Polyangiaceae bacterium]